MRRLTTYGIILTLGSAFLACAPALRTPTADDAAWAATRWPGLTVAELEHGRERYVRRCSGCHHLHRPEDVSAERWPLILDEMETEAKLAPGEREAILRFVLTVGRGRASNLAVR